MSLNLSSVNFSYGKTLKTTVTGIEMFHKTLDRGEAGDNMGVLVRGLKREDVMKGMVAAKPTSVSQHTKFEAQMYVLSKEEGGRHTPFINGYRPQLFIRTGDISCKIELPEGKMVMPGEDASFLVELINPLCVEVTACYVLVPLLSGGSSLLMNFDFI